MSYQKEDKKYDNVQDACELKMQTSHVAQRSFLAIHNLRQPCMKMTSTNLGKVAIGLWRPFLQ